MKDYKRDEETKKEINDLLDQLKIMKEILKNIHYKENISKAIQLIQAYYIE